MQHVVQHIDPTKIHHNTTPTQMDPASHGDKLLAAMAALIQIKNMGQDADTVAHRYLAPNVVMHADPAGAFFSEDHVGIDAFMKAPQQYGDTYSFTRRLIASALTPKGDWGFAWWCDEDVTVTDEWRTKLPEADARSNIMGAYPQHPIPSPSNTQSTHPIHKAPIQHANTHPTSTSHPPPIHHPSTTQGFGQSRVMRKVALVTCGFSGNSPLRNEPSDSQTHRRPCRLLILILVCLWSPVS